MCAGIHISWGYTYHCDTGTSTLWISCPRLAGDWAGLLWKCITGYLVYVQDGGGQGGLAAAFDLAAYEGYMIARVKKSVNHSRVIQSMRKASRSFLFRRHIGFSGSRGDRKCVQSCNLTSIYSPLFIELF